MSLFEHFRNVRRPAHYQGWGQSRRYFEGWYYKLVVPGGPLAYAIIPGVSMDAKGEQHAFIQVLDGIAARSRYHRFTAADFQPVRGVLEIRIGADNVFTDAGLRLQLPGLRIEAEFLQPHPWPRRLVAPGVMGYFGYLPGMQCYHGLVSLHHGLSGSLTDASGTHSLAGGTGYVEKDWGRSFPNAWVWAQSNHLESEQPTSLMVSVADIPWLGTRFTGFLATLLWEGELHTFATWTGAKHQLSFGDNSVTLVLTDRRRRLVVTGHPAAGGELASPLAGAMTGKINESLQATLDVAFTLDGHRRYSGPARWAGLEVTDNAQRLLAP